MILAFNMCMTRDVNRPQWTSRAGVGAASLIALMSFVQMRFITMLVRAFSQQAITAFIRVLTESPWAVATLADYVTGAIVAAFWIGLHPMPLLPQPWNSIWAISMPALGNPALWLYVMCLLIRERNIMAAFTPFHVQQVKRDTNATSNFQKKPYIYLGLFMVTAIIYFSVLLLALLNDELVQGYHVFRTEPLVRATFFDNLMGIAFAGSVMFAREGKSLKAALWICCIAVLGNGVFCIYAMYVLAESLELQCSFGEAFGSSKSDDFRSPQYV